MKVCRVWMPGFFPRVALLLALVGCGRNSTTSDGRTSPNPNAPALYGPPTGVASKEIPLARPLDAGIDAWRSAPFYLLQTDLSPALLVHSDSRHLGLFTGTTNYGLGAPKFVAWSTMNGPRTFKRGEKLDVAKMEECWMLVWWAGAEGWTNWDSPWVLYLQHKPEAMSLDEDGLHLEFPRSAGDVALMPLYGYEKPPQKGRDYLAEHGLAGRKTRIKTWDWPEVLTRDPLTRIRYWAAVTRELPIYCEDSFSVDRANDSVTIRSKFQRRSIDDDWKTRRIKLAPLSPTLALAVKSGGLPVQFSKPWFDLDYATPYGPYFAVQGADEFDATFPVLQYVTETEASEPPATNAHPAVLASLARLQQLVAQEFADDNRNKHDSGSTRLRWDAEGGGWLAKALPFSDPKTRTNAVVSLRELFHAHLTRGLGGASEGGASALKASWAYAHFTGDWSLIKENWPQLRKLAMVGVESQWAGFGRAGLVGLGDRAASRVAFARLAYKVGDMDSYNYACYSFARELVHLFVKQRGADYFRQLQPWHSMEFVDDEVFLTHLSGDTRGWMMDGPKFPAGASERLFEKRWMRFNDADSARFYRDYLRDDVRREMNWLQHRWEPKRRWHNEPHDLPSLVQLRSLLLNEGPVELAAVATPGQFTGPASGQVASCLSVLRTSHPTRYDRLIPAGEPSSFVAGIEREVAEPNPALVVGIESGQHEEGARAGQAAWPRLTWSAWQTPTGAAWTFGHIRTATNGFPVRIRSIPLNWNARVLVADLP
jgi:hypothetical protein